MNFLSDTFVAPYEYVKPDWGFASGPNSLGEITYLRSYSQNNERWFETVRRVVEETYQILWQHCQVNHIPFDADLARNDAEMMYDLMFNFKFEPGGRGVYAMGTDAVRKKSSMYLFNCSFVTTENIDKDPITPFIFMLDVSMCGVGCGFDVRGAGKIVWDAQDSNETNLVVVEDSREGWCNATKTLLEWAFGLSPYLPVFDYSEIRPKGAPIVTSGGVAPGPEPLMKLHGQIFEIERNRRGEKISEKDIADIMNMIGVCVVSGGKRRTAQIMFGDAHSDEYINLKNYDLHPDRMEFGWASNNSVFAEVGMDYSRFIDRIADNGEPGFVWLDNVRRHGRMSESPNDKNWRVKGLNPCVAGDTWVMTTNGPRRVTDLIDTHAILKIDGQSFKSVDGFFKTGVKDVYTLTTLEGYVLNLTKDHKVLLSDNRWVEAQNLREGDKIVIHNHDVAPYWGGHGTAGEGYLVGHFLGNGTWQRDTAIICSWGDTIGEQDVRNSIQRIVGGSWYKDGDRWEMRTQTISKYVQPGTKFVSDEIQTASWSFQRMVLQGLFDTDGHVEGSSTSGDISIRLAQSNLEFLHDIQRMLLRVGIRSRINQAREAGMREMPDGNGGLKEYYTSTNWRLIISTDCPRFMKYVGFGNSEKSDKYYSLVDTMKRDFYNKPFEATFLSLESVGEQEVYDVQVPGINAFDANGLYVHNCGEATLEDMETCNLVEVYPERHATIEEFQRTLKYALIYAKAVTLIPTHWKGTNAVSLRNRRIGIGPSGLVQFAIRRGKRELIHWLSDGYKTLKKYDTVYSEWLCIRESISLTVVKPSGTMSLLSGSTPGVHYPTYRYYIRRMRFRDDSELLAPLIEAGYKTEQAKYEPMTTIVEFPVAGDDDIPTEREVSVGEKFSIAVLLQKFWADQSVSATITFDKEKDRQAVVDLLSAYDSQLKSISLLPFPEQSSYEQMPYEAITKDEYEQMISNIKPIDWGLINGHDIDVKFCDSDSCEI